MSSHAGDLRVTRSESASAGITPSSFCLANVCSRKASHPSANCPSYLSAHSFGTW